MSATLGKDVAPERPMPAADPYPPGPGEDASAVAVGWQVARMTRLIHCMRSRMRTVEDVPEGGDLQLLAILCTVGPHRLTDLSAMASLDVSTLSRQAASLVRRGLLERRPVPKDGRGTLLAPTADGVAAFEAFRRRRSEILSGMLANWGEEDRALLISLLERLNNDLEDHIHPRHPEAESVVAAAGRTATRGGDE